MKKVIIVWLTILTTFTLCNATITVFWESPVYVNGACGAVYKYGTDKIKYIFLQDFNVSKVDYYDAENGFSLVGSVSDTLCDLGAIGGYVDWWRGCYFDINNDNRPDVFHQHMPLFPDTLWYVQFFDMLDATVIWQCNGMESFWGHIETDSFLKLGIWNNSEYKLTIYDLGVNGSSVSGALPELDYRPRTTVKNAPNPFSKTTNIRFGLSKTSTVRLDIYNQIGQKVTTLTDGKLNRGEHVIPWNANGVASGLYFYRLIVDGNATTEKTIIIK